MHFGMRPETGKVASTSSSLYFPYYIFFFTAVLLFALIQGRKTRRSNVHIEGHQEMIYSMATRRHSDAIRRCNKTGYVLPSSTTAGLGIQQFSFFFHLLLFHFLSSLAHASIFFYFPRSYSPSSLLCAFFLRIYFSFFLLCARICRRLYFFVCLYCPLTSLALCK